MAKGVIGYFKITHKDVNYCTLPLYHTAGGILGVGSCILAGATLAIRRKFSASRFWDECVEYRATVRCISLFYLFVQFWDNKIPAILMLMKYNTGKQKYTRDIEVLRGVPRLFSIC